MRVAEIMNPYVVSITPDETAALAARLLQRHNIGSLPVCLGDGTLRGIVTDRDIVTRCIAAESDPNATRIREIMTRGVATVTPDDDIREATRLMAAEQVRRLPVVKENRVVGMLSLGDMARHHAYNMEASKALSEISANIRRPR